MNNAMTDEKHEIGRRHSVAATERARRKPRTVRAGKIQVLVAYDIGQTRVRSRVARILESEGARMQGSVFVLEGSESRIAGILKRVGEVEGLREAVCGGSVLHGVVAYRIRIGMELLGVGACVPRETGRSALSFGPYVGMDGNPEREGGLE